jgi:DNA-binding NarL/FixJ family response regulator
MTSSALSATPTLLAAVDRAIPDLAVIDVRMPPTMTDDGARPASRLREQHPTLPMLLLSQRIESRHSIALVASGSFGYPLKDRVLRVDDFLDAARRVAEGGSALDPEVVRTLLAPAQHNDPLGTLSEREREVLALVAEGRSNSSVATHLVVAERTVETHMRSIFRKLDIEDTATSTAVCSPYSHTSTRGSGLRAPRPPDSRSARPTQVAWHAAWVGRITPDMTMPAEVSGPQRASVPV